MGNQQSLFDTLIHGNNRNDCRNYQHRKTHYHKHSYTGSTASFNSFQSAFHFSSNSRNHNPKDCCALWKTIKSILGIWTTGNSEIDEIIKETQRTASKHHKPWRWIPFDRFEELKLLAKGGYGNVYSAWCSDRDLCGKVALKSLEHSENISKEYLQKLRAQAKFEHSGGIIRIYGMTKNTQTNNYMLVMKLAKCNLRQYINKYYNILSLSNKIELLVPISNGLKKIHQAGLIHGNFHPGNILQTYTSNSSSAKVYATPQTWSCISDLGLCGPASNELISNEPKKVFTEKGEFVEEPEMLKYDDDYYDYDDDDDILNKYILQEKDLLSYSRQTSTYEKSKVYGVLPYMAPEVLRGQKYTQSADIYAFGFIIYEVFMGHPPYHDVPHDLKLAQNICKGHRPEISSSHMPHRIMKLITRCWDSKPEERPTAQEIHNTIRGWYWRLDPEMKSLMRADDDARSRSGTPITPIISINKDNRDNSGFSTPQSPGTPTAVFASTPFTTPLNTSISHAYSNSTCKSPLSANSTTSSTMSTNEINGYRVHPEAIYTSRLLEFDDLPQTAAWYY